MENKDKEIPVVDSQTIMLQKQSELENAYKSICAQEVLLIDQLKQVQDQRQAAAGQIELMRSLVA